MIIDTSYFLNKSVFIPNVVNQPNIGGNNPNKTDVLKQEIDEKEAKLLISALGFEQHKELSEQFNTDGSWKTDALQKWKYLTEGKTLENGKRWNGLRYSYGSKKISIIAYYVYFYFLSGDFSTYTATGIQIANAENSETQTPNQKQSEAWNTFVKMYNGSNLCGRNYNFFQNWNGIGMQWNGSNGQSNEVSLYEFLSAYPEDYDLSFFKRETIINAWNL